MSEEQESKKQAKARQLREAREWLQRRFPEVFQPGVPLAIGIHGPIHETARAEGGPEPWAVRAALDSWTRHPKYLKGLIAQRTRRHLDGSEAEPVTAEQAERARQQLAELERKRQQTREDEQRRKAKQQDQGKKTPQGQRPQGQQERKAADGGKASGGRPTITLKKKRRRGAGENATRDEGGQ